MISTTRIDVARYDSPIGQFSLASVNGRLVHLDFEENDDRLHLISSRRFKKIDWCDSSFAPLSVLAWLDAYFAGRVMALPIAEIDLRGTDFQKSVWQALIEIPSGTSVSYGGLAASLDNPKAVRAVARANALNPVSIIVPCHRVIGADGTLTGYAGGLARKKWLLDHEAEMARKHV
ncbi:methylated-DNA--[protein]-cysteine S-methyltransferase [uncultured Thalassospira sp.]|uniref:methylated-DNA--[protein]-cysteine S-methyltransferase n=1 Tax=uncultured Thalassospira sp. TaxID=404382 RepID=UPI0030D9AA03|tara:strand:- start:1440 stop:1967 length:528 start_codon:yes stop_codon:yes gene_type:complete